MTEIARGEIHVEVDDREAMASLRRIEGEFDRTMAKIDREEAEAKIGADLSELKRDIKAAEAELEKFDRRRADADLTAGQRKYAASRAKALEQELADIKKLEQAEKRRLNSAKQKDRELSASEKRLSAIAKREQQREAALAKADRRQQAASRRQLADERRLASAKATEDRRAATARTKAERDAQRAESRRRREISDIPKMREEYVKLVDRVEKLATAKRKAGRAHDERAVIKIEVSEEAALARISTIKEELEKRGSPVDLPVHVHTGRNFGLALRKAVGDGYRDRGVRGAVQGGGIALGVLGGDAMARGFRRSFTPKALVQAGARGFARVGHALERLSESTVRLGPFTTSIRTAALALSVLGPLLVDIAGGAGALVGVVGSATLGLGALGVAVAGGAIPALAGFVGVLKPVIGETKSALAASKAYNDAVLKHGKNSEQAGKKLEEMHNVLKGVDSQTRRNFVAGGKLNQQWTKLTQPARAAAFHVIGQGLKFASDNVAEFAAKTNTGFGAVQRATDGWFKTLSSAEGRGLLGSMWDNFNASIEPVLNGVGKLGLYLGRVGAVASTYLPSLAGGFERWSQSILDSSNDSEALAKKVDGVVQSLKSVGRFAMASGRFLKSFFAGAVGPGRSFVDTMTNALNRWTRFLSTVEGQTSLHDFFQRSVTGVQALFSALAPIGSIFVRWASDISPIVQIFFRGTGAVASFVHALMGITVLRGPLTAITATLGALWAVGKISAATTAAINFTKALVGIKTAEEGIAAAQGVQALSGTAAGLTAAGSAAALTGTRFNTLARSSSSTATAVEGFGAGAAASGARVGILRAGATALVPAIGEMGAIAGGAATAGLGLLAAGAIYGTYKMLTMKSTAEKLGNSFRDQTKHTNETAQGYRNVSTQLADLGGMYARSRLTVKQAREELAHTKKGTDEHRVALLNYRDALRQNVTAQQQWAAASKSVNSASLEQAKTDEKRLKTVKEQIQDQKHRIKIHSDAINRERGEYDKLDDLQNKYKAVYKQATQSANRARAAGINLQREYGGLSPVLGKAEQQLGALARQSRGLATKIAVKFEAPKDVGRIAANASRALKAGVPKKLATKVVADSTNAEQAVKRLQRLTIKAKVLRILQRGGPDVERILSKIAGRKLTAKEQRIVQRGGPGVISLLAKITGHKLSQKEQRIIQKGGPNVLSVLNRIIGTRIANKIFRIIARDNASSVVGNVRSILNSFSDKDVYVRVHVQRQRMGGPKPADGGILAADGAPMLAGGGTGAGPDRRRQERAAQQAARRAPLDIKSGGRKISRPTAVIGEENRPEYIIATNPRYRRRNLGLLRQAARSLGSDLMPVAGVPMHAGGYEGYNPVSSGYRVPNWSGAGQKVKFSKKKVKRYPKSKKVRDKTRKTGKHAIKIPSNPYWQGINSLLGKQEDLEREASIREGQVREPEDFINEVKDAQGNVTSYTFDQKAWDGFRAQIDAVEKIYKMLTRVVQEIHETVPKARKAFRQQISTHTANISVFKHALAKERKRLKTKGKSQHAKNVRKQAAKRIKKLSAAMNKEGEDRTKKRENSKLLSGIDKEAGFDFREYMNTIADLEADKGEKYSAAQQQIKEGPGAGGGGGGDIAAPYAAQAALVDTQRANVLEQFGSNFANKAASTPITGPSGRSAVTEGGVGGTNQPGIVEPMKKMGSVGAATAPSSPPSGAGSLGGAAIHRASQGGEQAGSQLRGAVTARTQATTGPAAAGAGGGDTNVQVTNNFTTAPSDPHTWSKGIQFELGAAI